MMKLAGHSSVTASQRHVHPTLDGRETAFGEVGAVNRTAPAKVKRESLQQISIAQFSFSA